MRRWGIESEPATSVRFDGGRVELAGFVQDMEIAEQEVHYDRQDNH